MKDAINKADVLIEALPYIQRFRGSTIVVKFGGSAMEDKAHYESILADVAFMECVDMAPVIVHGGGKAISKRMQEQGLQTEFVAGLRVTDHNTIRIVAEVIKEEVNPRIVATIEKHGGRAQGLNGEDIFRVAKLTRKDSQTGEELDWGFVGSLQEVDIEPILTCIAADTIPVITPLGKGEDGNIYNINADDAAAATAKALKARKLVFLSDVPGLLKNPDDPESILSTLSMHRVEDLIEKSVIAGGMLPKVKAGVDALHAGVVKVHIVDGRLPHSLLLEIFTDKGVGTEIVHDEQG